MRQGEEPDEDPFPRASSLLSSPLAVHPTIVAIIPARMGSGDGLVHYIDHKRNGARGVEGDRSSQTK
jgi:hypothetical protein